MAIVTDNELVEWVQFTTGSTTFVVADINRAIQRGVDDFIERKTGVIYDSSTRTIVMNGNGERYLYLDERPIVELDEVKIIKKDLEEVTLVLTGTDRELWFDAETGKLEIIKHVDGLDDLFSVTASKFLEGLSNIEITGKFVGTVDPLAKLVSLLLYSKQTQIFATGQEKFDLMEEKIGRYAYKVGVPSNQSDQNQYKGLDGLIEWYFLCLEQANVFEIG